MILGIFDWFRKKPVPEEPEEEYIEQPIREMPLEIAPTKPRTENELRFDKSKIIYELEITNTTSEIMGGINIMIEPTRANIVNIEENQKSIEMLDPDQTENIQFELTPTLRCGKTAIRGILEYFDFGIKDRRQVKLPSKVISFISPELKGLKIDEDTWRTFISHYNNVEVESDAFNASPTSIFKEFSSIIQETNLYMLAPVVIPNIYRGTARYFGADREGSQYAIEFQLIGSEDQSKFLLRAWGDNPERNMAICCKIIDDFSKITKIDIKNYIIT